MKKKIACVFLSALLLVTSLPFFALTAAALDEQDGYDITWPLGQALPHFGTPATILDGMNLISASFEARLAAASLQGIVNREQPRLLLINEHNDPWPSTLGLQVNMLANWMDAIEKHKDKVKGLVVYNPDIPDTANVATTIAGIDDCLAVSPDLANIISANYGLAVLTDLRNVESIVDKYSAYRYMYENYWDKCTRRTISGLAPGNHTQLRDFSVAVKAAVMWLDPKVAEDKAVMDLFFKDTSPIDTYYTGWWPDEGQGIAYASKYGVMTIPSDFYENYTVYSGMSRKITTPTVPAKPELQNGKIYVSLNLSDGDNIQYDQHAMYDGRLWRSADRGKVPIGWTASPALLDAGPQILNHYYETATENDVLICGPSGLGYSSAANWPNAEFAKKYAEITNSYFEKSAFNIITMWVGVPPTNANWYTKYLPSLLGMTAQERIISRIRYTDTGVPLVWFGSDNIFSQGAMSYDSGIDNMKTRLSSAAKLPTVRPQFYIAQASAWATSVSDLVRLVDELNAEFPGKFEFVRPDHFMMLLNEEQGYSYQVSLQKTAEASSEAPDNDAAKAFDGSFSTGWEAAAAGEAYIQTDLGDSFKLDRYVIKNASTNYADEDLNTMAWELQISGDGVNWTTVDSVSDNTEAIVYRNLNDEEARYVRLLVKDAGTDGIARIQDLEIYGKKDDNAMEKLTKLLDKWRAIFFKIVFMISEGINLIIGN